MARYIMKLKQDAHPDAVMQASFASDNSPQIKISKLYPSTSRDADSGADAQVEADDVQSEIARIRAELDRVYVVEVSDSRAAETVVELSQHDDVESIEPDREVEEYTAIPNDSYWTELYGLHKLNCVDAWDIAQGNDVLVAVVDSGVDVKHPDLAGNIWSDGNGNNGYNEVDHNYDVTDTSTHGTHVSGTIGAILNNGPGVVGVAPKCRIVPFMGLKNGRGPLSVLLVCIRKAVDMGVKVINNSWGPGNRNPDTDLVLRYAYLHDVTVVFAAGNNGRVLRADEIATNPYVISVAAVDNNDRRASYSNFGNEVTVSAPGSSIISTVPNNNYGWKSGTSMAAPHVTGLVALLLSKKSSLKPDDIKAILQQSADPINDNTIGAGRINAKKALDMV
jgi:thermitase